MVREGDDGGTYSQDHGGVDLEKDSNKVLSGRVAGAVVGAEQEQNQPFPKASH